MICVYQAVIVELEESVDFEVIHTADIQATVNVLAAITADLIRR